MRSEFKEKNMYHFQLIIFEGWRFYKCAKIKLFKGKKLHTFFLKNFILFRKTKRSSNRFVEAISFISEISKEIIMKKIRF